MESTKLRIAITGTLKEPRSVVAQKINATRNGEWTPNVNAETHYLVAASQESRKLYRAARLGTAVISPEELEEYLAAGEFPSTELPVLPKRTVQRPDIEWDYSKGDILCVLSYVDGHGRPSVRRSLIVATGHTVGNPDMKWLGGYDGPFFKTWRQDRVVSLEPI